MITKKCPCGKKFKVHLYRKDTAKYCSQSCKSKYSPHPRLGTSKYKPKRCAICGKEFRKIKHTPEQWKVAKYCSVECSIKSKVGVKQPYKRESFLKIQHKHNGKAHWNWKGGITLELSLLRHSDEYKEWRNAVYRRDGWRCQKCGKKIKNIVAHHIKSFKHFPELRYSVKNGKTLCRPCHKHEHKKVGMATRFS